MAGRVFGMGAFRGFTAVPASTFGPMAWELPGPAERAHQTTVVEPAPLDHGLVAR